LLVCHAIIVGPADKPRANLTYSIFEHADVCAHLWARWRVVNAVIVAQDMGDSVAFL
jgi:hypothetical protein